MRWLKNIFFLILLIIPLVLYSADSSGIALGSFIFNNPQSGSSNKWIFMKEEERSTIRHDSGFFAEVHHYNAADTAEKIAAIIKDFKEANVALNIGIKSDVVENIGQNKFRHIIIEGNDAFAHLFLLVENKEILEIRLFISKTSEQTYNEFINFLSFIKIHSAQNSTPSAEAPAASPATEQPSPAPVTTASNPAEILKVGIFTFKNLENNKWSVLKEGEGLILKHEIGFTGNISYKTGEAENIINSTVTGFKSNHASLNSETELDQSRQLGELKYRMLKIKGADDSAFIYIMNVKNHVLVVEFSVWNTNIEAVNELENILSAVQVDNVAEPVVAPAPVQPVPVPAPVQQPQPAPVEPVRQQPETVTPAPTPAPAPVEPQVMQPPQRVIIENDDRLKNKTLFKNSIYNSNYPIKLGMKFSEYKKLVKSDAIKIFTPDEISRMSLYKFKLMGTSKPWLEKYALAFSRIRPLKVVSVKYVDRMLILFFYADVLYSIKMREEGVITQDYRSTINKLKVKFRGKTAGYEYGSVFKAKFNRFSTIEYSSYNFDTSAEMTIYSNYYVRRIEKEIQAIMRRL